MTHSYTHSTFSNMVVEVDMKKTFKRDALADIEAKMQSKWETEKTFESDAPIDANEPKYLATFPYPYMNGRLHLGHAFTFSKAEFAIGYERLKGKRTLFPFGFHCTGMPIKACADKLSMELDNISTSNSPSLSKHSKVAAKTGGETSQYKIMLSMGIPEEEIPKFRDPKYWMIYFPPKAIQDLKALGSKIDWRRSFITTDINPFYDSFIRWQFHQLKAQDRIRYGKRHTIYSPKDGQPCMDHDRASGEGVEPQEYTGIKLILLQSSPKPWPEQLEPFSSYTICLVAATLRPETLYGMTNVWVGPDVTYGLFTSNQSNLLYLCTERAARNMSFQGYSKNHGVVEQLATIKGSELIGLSIKAPMTSYEKIYIYPLMSVLSSKGTGIVSSVPSDSPDDYAALRDLREKPLLRQKYSLTDDQVLPFQQLPVVQTEGYDGPFIAEILCQKYGVKSQNDRDGLSKAKAQAYKDGFYGGTMVAGPFSGKPVSEVKQLIKDKMLQYEDSISYSEPENTVMSRSGDECVVALIDQWYINYGEPGWKSQVVKLVEKMNLYHPEVRNQMENILNWLGQWACSRSFGLGTKLPWDPQYLIESLSDSTIYMAYYTVAHILQGNLDGSIRPFNIKPEQMTDEIWSWIFSEKTLSLPKTDIPTDLLQRMKREFDYFYPLDLRVSGKDLLFNHLTFMLYNHVSIFSEKYYPKSIRVNGHLLLNSEKMSKSTGNFMTISESISQFTADGTRFALADAGDALDDANFLVETANSAILRLYTQLEFIQHVSNHSEQYKHDKITTFHEKVFDSRISKCVEQCQSAYEATNYREALKYGFYELQNARDRYREVCHGEPSMMNYELLLKFIEVQAIIISPIVPHFCEYIWSQVLKKPNSIMVTRWPVVGSVDEIILASDDYLVKTIHQLRISLQSVINLEQKKAKKQDINVPTKITSLDLYVAANFPEWQEQLVSTLKECYNDSTKSFCEDDLLIKQIASTFDLKREGKKFMPFLMEMKKQVESNGPKAFNRLLPFSEYKILMDNIEYIKSEITVTNFNVISVDHHNHESFSKFRDANKAQQALPGEPSPLYY